MHYEAKTDVKFGVINNKLLIQDFCMETKLTELLAKQPAGSEKSCTPLIDDAFIRNQIV
jgi:hypothetical protein